jgi:uncharacterized protein with HEPN domain
MWRDAAYLLDMLIAARRVREFLVRVTQDEFMRSRLHQDAVMRSLQIIGEAARKVLPETKQAHPEIPWHSIIGLRHRLVHDYTRIDVTKVWRVADSDVPDLIKALEPLVPPEDERTEAETR